MDSITEEKKGEVAMKEMSTLERLSAEFDKVVHGLVPLGGAAALSSEALKKLHKEFEAIGHKVPALKKVADQIHKVISASGEREATRALLDLLSVGPTLMGAAASTRAGDEELTPVGGGSDRATLDKLQRAAGKQMPLSVKDYGKWLSQQEGAPKPMLVKEIEKVIADKSGPYFYLFTRTGKVQLTKDGAGLMSLKGIVPEIKRVDVFTVGSGEGRVWVVAGTMHPGDPNEVQYVTLCSDKEAAESKVKRIKELAAKAGLEEIPVKWWTMESISLKARAAGLREAAVRQSFARTAPVRSSR